MGLFDKKYCDICGESLAKCTCKMPDEDLEKRVYILEGIDCANCAAKVEDAIKKIDGVNNATVSFMTQKLTLDADDARFDEILQKVVAAAKKIEPDCELHL